MAEIANAYVSLMFSAKGADRQIAQAVTGPADKVGRKAGDRAGKAYGSAFSGAVKGTLGAIGVAAGLDVGVKFLKDSISEASDLNESASKTRAIFGRATDAVNAFAAQGAKALGQSKLDVLDAASTFGTFGKAAGLGGKDLAKFSTGFVGLSTDLASFFNTSPEQAVEAIGAALRGEAEPIRQYGVLLDDATLRQEALRLGLVKTTKQALTPQQKVLAAQAAIYKQTKDAQGDFQRTSGGLANQQRILGAQFKDLEGTLGRGLLPLTTKLVKKTSEFVDEFQTGTGVGGDFRDVLEDTRDVGKGVLAFFDSIPGPVKKYGIELAIAAVALNKINNGLTSGRAAITNWVGTLASSETQMTRVQRASYALGVGLRNVGGAGGMLAVADGANRSNKALGTLETTAGAAAVGFAVGGPVGAAVGGLAGLTLSVARNTHDAAKAAKVSLPSWKEYGGTLDGVSASTTRATRAMVLQRLEQSGLLEATRKLGLSDREAVNAMLGSISARQHLAAELRVGHNLTEDQRAALERETGAVARSRLETLQHNVAIAQNARELRAAKDALHAFMREPANMRLSITGIEAANARLQSLRETLRSVFGLTKDLNTSGAGDIGNLLLLPSGKKRRALGGPVAPGSMYIGGERGPEEFTVGTRGHITNANQLQNIASSSSRRVLVQIGAREFEGWMTDVADSRIDASSQIAGMQRRAFD